MQFTITLTLAMAIAATASAMSVPRPWIHDDVRTYRELSKRDVQPRHTALTAKAPEPTPTATAQQSLQTRAAQNTEHYLHSHEDYLPELDRTYTLHDHEEYLTPEADAEQESPTSLTTLSEQSEEHEATAEAETEKNLQRRCSYNDCKDQCGRGGVWGAVSCMYHCAGNPDMPLCPGLKDLPDGTIPFDDDALEKLAGGVGEGGQKCPKCGGKSHG